jgi:hypothetical protein
MPYPPVIQFEALALEAEAQTRLARELRADRAPRRSTRRSRRFTVALSFSRLRRGAESSPCPKL